MKNLPQKKFKNRLVLAEHAHTASSCLAHEMERIQLRATKLAEQQKSKLLAKNCNFAELETMWIRGDSGLDLDFDLISKWHMGALLRDDAKDHMEKREVFKQYLNNQQAARGLWSTNIGETVSHLLGQAKGLRCIVLPLFLLISSRVFMCFAMVNLIHIQCK